MALQHLRSSTANKRPTPAAMAEGQLAMNTEATSPGLFFKNASGALVKVGPVHVGTTAPNASPASGGETGNTVGEQWLDTTGGTYNLKIWDGTAWRSEAGEFVNVTGDTMTGALVMDNQQQVRFRETTANGTNYIAIQAPASVASDKTLTLPDATGTLVSTGDSGTVTSTMIADGTILNADINASAAIAGTKISPDFGSQNVTTTGNITVNAQGDLRFGDSDSSNWVAFQAPGTVASNVTWTLPSADGTSDQVLKTDGAGTLSWGTAAGDKISEGNTEAEVVDTGTDGHFKVTTEGTERLRIDKDGNLLKGLTTARSNFITAPGTIPTFQIEGTGNAAIGSITYYGNDTSGPAWGLAKSRGTTAGSSTTVVAGDSTGDIYFFGANGTTMQPTAQIGSVVDTAGTVSSTSMPGALVFYTTPTGTNIPTQRLRISESGSIGIGVTPKSSANSSVSTLEIGRNTLRGGQTSFSIYQNGYWDASTGFDKRIFTGSATQYYQDTYFSWSTSGSGAADSTISFTERMRLDSSGRLGLGTSAPGDYTSGADFVVASSAGNGAMTLAGANAGSPTIMFKRVSSPGTTRGYIQYDNTSEWMRFGTNGSEALRIDSSGRLGIGSTSPQEILEVRKDSAGASVVGALFTNASSNANTAIGISFSPNVGGTTRAASIYGVNETATQNATALTFFTNANAASGTEKARIDSSGRLLVGTSTSTNNIRLDQKFAVVGTSSGNPCGISLTNYTGTTADNPVIIDLQRSRGTSDGSMTVVASGDSLGSLIFRGADGTNFVNAARIDGQVDGTPGTNDMPGRLVFSTTADGASSPTERARIDSSGNLLVGATSGPAGYSGNIFVGTNNGGFYFDGPSAGTFGTSSNQAMVLATNLTERMRLDQAGGLTCVGVYNGVTLSAANVNVDSGGAIKRSTSSLKYKKDVETLADEYADAILKCRPVWYRSKVQTDNASWGWWGFIAEEVAAIDPRLVQWKTTEITYDEKGSAVQTACDPEPEGVQYDRFVPHLLNLIKRQKEQIESMEARLSALEAA